MVQRDVSGLMGRAALAANDKTPPKPQNVISPDAALDRLTKGNARYVKGTTLRHDFAHEREALSTGQNPFAAILKLRRFVHRSRTLLRHGAWRPVCLPHRRQFCQRRNGDQPGIRCAGAQDALGHGTWARSVRRGGRHHQVAERRDDPARSSAVSGRCSQACG